ncbi:MAG: hypothetical protein HC855_02040 [Rhizobiales bacterium]|nr:hypothetical protein [Hyphomicrobiales bacterium]
MDGLWFALEHSAFGGHVRNSTFLYPAANVIHVLAVLSFFGLVATMDLRLLRVIDGTPAREVIARLRPLALIAFLAIAATGFILFTAEATAISGNIAFQVKVMAIVLALLNVALNSWAMKQRGEATARLTAGVSLGSWLFIAAMGRTIAYV